MGLLDIIQNYIKSQNVSLNNCNITFNCALGEKRKESYVKYGNMAVKHIMHNFFFFF